MGLGKDCCLLTIKNRRKNVPRGTKGIGCISFDIPNSGRTGYIDVSLLSNGMNRLSDSYKCANHF